MDRADAESEVCSKTLLERPEFADVFQRFRPHSGMRPTLAQMADEGVPTPYEARLFVEWHTQNQTCRQRYLEAVRIVSPDAARATSANYAEYDDIYAALARREITWGVANTRFVNVLSKAAERQARAAAQTDMRLQASHQK